MMHAWRHAGLKTLRRCSTRLPGILILDDFRTIHAAMVRVMGAETELDLLEAVLSVGQEHLVSDNAVVTMRRLRCVGERLQDGSVITCVGGVAASAAWSLKGRGPGPGSISTRSASPRWSMCTSSAVGSVSTPEERT